MPGRREQSAGATAGGTLARELLDMMTGNRTTAAPLSQLAQAQGISKCSRALNNKFRFAVRAAQMAPEQHL